MLSSIAARAIFYPSLAYNVFMERLSVRQWYNHIDEHVILGALPLRSMNNQLVEIEGVRAVVSLNEEYELRYTSNQPLEWKALGVDNIRFEVIDMFEAPSQEMLIEGVRFINDNISKGGRVYVHCKAGRSRSATLVGCYLMEKNKWAPDEAVSYMKSKRPHILLHASKMEALKEFYDKQVMGSSSS